MPLLCYRKDLWWANALGSEDLFREYASERDGSEFSRYECLLLDFLPDAANYMEIPVLSGAQGNWQTIWAANMFLACLTDAQLDAGDPQLANRFMRDYEDWYASRTAAMPVTRGRTKRGMSLPVRQAG
jgi:hypothetical protein